MAIIVPGPLVPTIQVSFAALTPTGGGGGYTYQWYKSTTPNFTPGAGNIMAGHTSSSLVDTEVQALTYYACVVNDGDADPAVATTQVAVAAAPTAASGTINLGNVNHAGNSITHYTAGNSVLFYHDVTKAAGGFMPVDMTAAARARMIFSGPNGVVEVAATIGAAGTYAQCTLTGIEFPVAGVYRVWYCAEFIGGTLFTSQPDIVVCS